MVFYTYRSDALEKILLFGSLCCIHTDTDPVRLSTVVAVGIFELLPSV